MLKREGQGLAYARPAVKVKDGGVDLLGHEDFRSVLGFVSHKVLVLSTISYKIVCRKYFSFLTRAVAGRDWNGASIRPVLS